MNGLPPDADDFLETAPTSARRGGLEVGGRMHALVSSSFDFATLPRASWSELLGSIRALGFRMVDVLVVWERHATEDGRFDFGETRPELDLGEFLRAAHACGLLVCVRPGPRHHDATSFSAFGIDLRVARECSMTPGKVPRGALEQGPQVAPLPSLASARYHAEAAAWLDCVAGIVDEARYPRGPVVAVHLDSEDSLLPYESGAGDSHPDAVLAHELFVKARYDRPSQLRSASEDDEPGVAPVEARHVTPGPLSTRFDWVVCQRQVASRAFDQLAADVVQRLVGLPVSLPEFPSRSRLKLRFCDVSTNATPAVRRWAANAKGQLADAHGGGTPLIDVQISSERDSTDLSHRVLSALASGARGFCVMPGCGGSNGPSLLTLDAEPSPTMQSLAPVLSALERLQFHTLSLEPCVQIVISDRIMDLGRLERSRGREREGWLIQETPLGDEETALPRELDQLQVLRDALGWLEASLVRHGVPFRYGSEWELDGIIGNAPWTVVPTTGVVSDELAETLSYARRRGLPCSVGPFVPEGRFEAVSEGWPLSLGATESAVEAQVRKLLFEAQLPQREVSPDVARALCHVRVDDGRAIPAALFVLNPSQKDVEVSVACPGSIAKDALTQAPIPSFAERLLVPVAAESIRMLELFPVDGLGDERY